MRIFYFRFLAISFFLFVFGTVSAQQFSVNVPSGNICPCQVITVTASWQNVQITAINLTNPANASGGPPGVGPQFTVSACNVGANNFTAVANGTGINGAVTQTFVFNVHVQQHVPLPLTYTANYCHGATATIIAAPGASSYIVTGPQPVNNPFPNVIQFGPLTQGHSGVYTITSIGTCTQVGTATINVAPNQQITVNSNSTVCLGDPVQLTSTVTGGQDYEWFNPLGMSEIQNQANYLLPVTTNTHTGTWSVTAKFLFNSELCPVVGSTSVTVINRNPVALSASPSRTVCQGASLSFLASSGGANAFTWRGPSNYGPVSGATQTLTNIAPSSAGIYSVVASFFGGNITCTMDNTIRISVVPVAIPQITTNLVGGNSICQGGQVQLGAAATGANVNYSWVGPYFGSGKGSGAVQNLSAVQPSTSGVYYVTASFVDGITCTSVNSVQINVVPLNSVSVIPPQPVCMPGNAHLQASAVNAIGYEWVGPNNFKSPGSNPVVYHPTTGSSGVYTVTARFGGGNLICYNTATVMLNVYPVLQFTLTEYQETCYNKSIKVQGPSGATSYSWTSSTGFSSNQKDLEFTSVQGKHSGTYTLTINLGPCVSSNSTTLKVYEPITFTLTPSSRTVCAMDTVPLEVGIGGGGENPVISWNPPVYLQDPTLAKQYAIPFGSVNYNVTIRDLTCPEYALSHSFNLFVKQPPLPKLEFPRTEACHPFTIHLNTKTGPESYNTTFDLGGSLQFQGDSIDYTIPAPGTYTLNVISQGTNGCTGIHTFPYPIISNPGPNASISWLPEQPTTVDDITFSSSSPSAKVESYSWSFSGGVPTKIDTAWQKTQESLDTSNVAQPMRRYENAGEYPVMLITRDDKQCIDTTVRWLKVIDDLSVYIPNTFTPNDDGVNDIFGVKGVGIKYEGFSFEILNRWGQSLFLTRDPNEGWNGKVGGRVSEDGVYVYKIRIVGMNGEGRKDYVGYFTLYK